MAAGRSWACQCLGAGELQLCEEEESRGMREMRGMR